jgi:hypothetical protein
MRRHLGMRSGGRPCLYRPSCGQHRLAQMAGSMARWPQGMIAGLAIPGRRPGGALDTRSAAAAEPAKVRLRYHEAKSRRGRGLPRADEVRGTSPLPPTTDCVDPVELTERLIDFDGVRLIRLRARAEALGLGLVESEAQVGRFAIYSFDRKSYVAADRSTADAPSLTLTEVDSMLTDIESRLQPI